MLSGQNISISGVVSQLEQKISEGVEGSDRIGLTQNGRVVTFSQYSEKQLDLYTPSGGKASIAEEIEQKFKAMESEYLAFTQRAGKSLSGRTVSVVEGKTTLKNALEECRKLQGDEKTLADGERQQAESRLKISSQLGSSAITKELEDKLTMFVNIVAVQKTEITGKRTPILMELIVVREVFERTIIQD